jgi:hypothetical protein
LGRDALLTCGVIGPTDALAGFANEGMATVAVLFVVAAGCARPPPWPVVQQTLGRPKTIVSAQRG